MKPDEIRPGARFRVKNGKAVIALLNGSASILGGRAPFSAHPYNSTSMLEQTAQAEGEEFTIVLAPGRKKLVYTRPQMSCKWIAICRVRDGLLMETLSASVKFDAVSVEAMEKT